MGRKSYWDELKPYIYGSVSIGFGLAAMAYGGVFSPLASSQMYGFVKPAAEYLYYTLTGFDDALLMLYGMHDLYKILMATGGSAVYGKKMMDHMRSRKEDREHRELEEEYSRVMGRFWW